MGRNRLLILLFLFFSTFILVSADVPPPFPVTPETEAELSAAFFNRLETKSTTKSLTFDLFTPEVDSAYTSPDGRTAVIWLALRDDSGRLLATEPGLVLGVLTDNGWQVLLPGDPGWDETFINLPKGLLPAELSPTPPDSKVAPNVEIQTLNGYYLPYAADTSRWLEGSISHFQSIPELGYPSCTEYYCRYAFDFTDSDHFPLLASKGGTVFATRDSCSDGDGTCTNYIVLYNASDNAYQIYLHLAHGTIPDKLQSGQPTVVRGQYLGDTDDTGYSTSQHVHFMVVNNFYLSDSGYYWGRSIDIRFADVGINNGLPRTCYEVTHFPIYDGATVCLGNRSDPRNPNNDWFESGNVGAFPPTGTLARPDSGAIVTVGANPLMDATATTDDDVRVAAVRMVAKLNNQWVEIGPKVTQPVRTNFYDWDVNLCDVGLLNGPLEVALRVWDHEGNVASALSPRTIQVDNACPLTSQLNPSTTYDSTAVFLNWSTNYDGSDIGSFDLQWRTDPGTWNSANMLNVSGSQRSTWFVGNFGTNYAFRLRVLDKNGVVEAWPANDSAETTASLPSNCSEDGYEQDDTVGQAKSLALGTLTQHNLCGNADVDWIRFNVVNPGFHQILALSQNGGAAVKITVYNSTGTTVLASSQAFEIGQPASVLFKPMASGTYTAKIEPLVPNLAGTGATYEVKVSEVTVSYMPLVFR
ncbi:MAG: M23 family metallopeptidase [Anaerolineaceae bacterium]